MMYNVLFWVQDLLTKSKVLMINTCPEQSYYFLNLILGSEGTQVTRAIMGITSNVQSNHRFQVFWENKFFKNFFEPIKPYLALQTSPFRGSYLLNFLIQAMVFEISRANSAPKKLFWNLQFARFSLQQRKFGILIIKIHKSMHFFAMNL